MSCEEMKDLIPAHSGGELEENERVALESHLDQCPECSAELSGFRENRAHLSGLKEVDPPSGTYSKIWAAVKNEFFPARIHQASKVLAYAALLLIGLSLGFIIATVSSQPATPDVKIEAKAPVTNDDAPAFNEYEGPGRYASPGANRFAPPSGRMRWYRPRPSRPSGSFYLPRVRGIVGDGEVDF